jgi:hypothetical protein
MFVHHGIAFERALRWLTTTGFEESPLLAMAVVLVQSDDSVLSTRLRGQYRARLFGRRHGLGMALGSDQTAPHIWERRIDAPPLHNAEPSTRRHLDGVLSLLGPPEAILSCLLTPATAVPATATAGPSAATSDATWSRRFGR